jgi:hypothetical protein
MGNDHKKVHIHIDASEKLEGLPDCGTFDRCPTCGDPLDQGFGLAGGGYGVYDYCPKHGVIAKTVTED